MIHEIKGSDDMFGFKRKKKNANPDVPKSKPYQPKHNVNQSHLSSWTNQKNDKKEKHGTQNPLDRFQ